MKKKILIICTIALLVIGLFSCSSGNPYEGVWFDNSGNEITLNNNKNFTAEINNQTWAGTYVQNYNTIAFKITSTQAVIVMTWDLRGNTLYLDWTDSDNEAQSLILYYKGAAAN